MDESVMKKILLALALLFAPTLAWGQCNGVFPANTVCGTVAGGPPGPITPPAAGAASVTNTDGTLTISPTTGAVVASIAQGAGTWRSAVVNDTVLTTDCGKTVQVGTGSTGWFTITVPSVSGFPAGCEVQYVNGDAGRLKKFTGLSGFTWLGGSQSIKFKIVNGAWAITSNPGLWIPTSQITLFYDSSTGNAANDCLAAGSGNACATANQAIGMLANYINNVNNIIIQNSGATNTAQIVAISYTGPGSVTLDGNTTPISLSSATGGCTFCIGASNGQGVSGIWNIRRYTVSNSASGIYGVVCAHSNCNIQDGMVAGTLTSASFLACTQLSNCVCVNDLTTTATVMLHLFDESDFSVMKCRNITVTLNTAGLTLSGGLLNVHGGGLIDVVGVTWTVTNANTITGSRYNIDLSGLIDSGACATIGGTSSGYTAGNPAPTMYGPGGEHCN